MGSVGVVGVVGGGLGGVKLVNDKIVKRILPGICSFIDSESGGVVTAAGELNFTFSLVNSDDSIHEASLSRQPIERIIVC